MQLMTKGSSPGPQRGLELPKHPACQEGDMGYDVSGHLYSKAKRIPALRVQNPNTPFKHPYTFHGLRTTENPAYKNSLKKVPCHKRRCTLTLFLQISTKHLVSFIVRTTKINAPKWFKQTYLKQEQNEKQWPGPLHQG